MSHIPEESVRCEFIFPSGRRCRQLRARPNSPFCFTHWNRQQQNEEAIRIGDEIVGPAGALNSQEGIHQALCNVFANLARGRISPRSAAVLGYVGQLMLVSRPSLESALKFELAVAALAQKAAQQKEKSEAAGAHRLHKQALLELAITNGTLDLFKTFREMSPDEGRRFMQFVRDYSSKDAKEPAPAANPSSPFAAVSQAASAAQPSATGSTNPEPTPRPKPEGIPRAAS